MSPEIVGSLQRLWIMQLRSEVLWEWLVACPAASAARTTRLIVETAVLCVLTRGQQEKLKNLSISWLLKGALTQRKAVQNKMNWICMVKLGHLLLFLRV